MARRDETTLRIVPLGGVDPETVARVAHGARRLSGARVEVVAPRRLAGTGRAAALATTAASELGVPDGTFCVGVGQRDDLPQAETTVLGQVGVVMLPARRAVDAITRAVAEVLEVLLLQRPGNCNV